MIQRSFLNAAGTLMYVTAFAWFMNHGEKFFGAHDNWVMPILLLLLLIISACVTGSLVLLKPVMLYYEGKKKEAVKLFTATVIWLFIFAVVVAGYLIVVRR